MSQAPTPKDPHAKDYYEVHVTVVLDRMFKPESEVAHGPSREAPWAYSEITDDPDLGAGGRGYWTTHTKTLEQAMQRIRQAKERWPHALRYKAEHIVYDERPAPAPVIYGTAAQSAEMTELLAFKAAVTEAVDRHMERTGGGNTHEKAYPLVSRLFAMTRSREGK